MGGLDAVGAPICAPANLLGPRLLARQGPGPLRVVLVVQRSRRTPGRLRRASAANSAPSRARLLQVRQYSRRSNSRPLYCCARDVQLLACIRRARRRARARRIPQNMRNWLALRDSERALAKTGANDARCAFLGGTRFPLIHGGIAGLSHHELVWRVCALASPPPIMAYDRSAEISGDCTLLAYMFHTADSCRPRRAVTSTPTPA